MSPCELLKPLDDLRVDLGSLKNVETSQCFGMLTSKHLLSYILIFHITIIILCEDIPILVEFLAAARYIE